MRLAAVKDQTVLICSHGDVIKAILADALGLHLDCFQRIVVAPASLSVIRYTRSGRSSNGSTTPGISACSGRRLPRWQRRTRPILAGSSTPTSDAVPGGVTR